MSLGSCNTGIQFEIVYRKGIANGNADALSRREPEIETSHAAMTTVYAGFTPEELKKAQKQDDAIQQLYTALNSQQAPLKNWKRPPMRRYAQFTYVVLVQFATFISCPDSIQSSQIIIIIILSHHP